MRTTTDAFHLAIPARDLDEAYEFYVEGLGCKLARRYDDRITLDFFGDQVVCHLSDAWEREPELYPRHFGVTFRERDDWDRLLALVHQRKLCVFAEPSERFADKVEKHSTFVLRDPSNNLLEFKHYDDPRMMY
ncbi:VOC family protein [Actinomycetospora endophytica]|uniref:VOC family protein n=1 Tax=Actinomycetospora endophytica TaxID=2291215 RepID=A0ABS8PCK5_9PSEU|nr:VOC family protein [Actinomycetospora endophytica]MCD2195987.1 VOC family protein [Actinomycetospora endophytica]